MNARSNLISVYGAAGIALLALTGAATADGYEEYSAPPPPAEEGRKFTYSFTIGATSDYVFRGVSQSDNDPVPQGSVDVGYGMLYVGVWGSGIDFGPPTNAETEIDWYGGIKPTWRSPFGDMDIDLGVIYYTYPNATDPGAELDYVELKAGYGWSPLHPKLTTGTVVYYSPDYTGQVGPVWTIETMAALELPKVWVFLPVINGLAGWQKGNGSDGYNVSANTVNPDDEYYYWNAGLALSVDNITFDLRYWDTNIGKDAGGLCARPNLCDERFVAAVKVSVP